VADLSHLDHQVRDAAENSLIVALMDNPALGDYLEPVIGTLPAEASLRLREIVRIWSPIKSVTVENGKVAVTLRGVVGLQGDPNIASMRVELRGSVQHNDKIVAEPLPSGEVHEDLNPSATTITPRPMVLKKSGRAPLYLSIRFLDAQGNTAETAVLEQEFWVNITEN